jgi:Galactose oxidase, central domain
MNRMRRSVARSLLLPLIVGLLACSGAGISHQPAAADGAIQAAASMNLARSGHTATLLPSGDVLIAGGMNDNGNYFAGCEVYSPATNRFTTVASMSAKRVGHTATLLANGQVLIAGGFDGDYLTNAELYDPATRQFKPTGQLTLPRSEHVAVRLNDGKVLLAGGVGKGESFLASAELYDPVSGRFTPTGDLTTPREGHTATLLKSGKVLVTGGHKNYREAMTVYASAEVYDPATGRFTTTGQLTIPRHKHAAALLADGSVLIVGGSDQRDWRGQYDSAELYDPAAGTFKAIGHMQQARYKIVNAIAALKDGKILIAGGAERAEIYDPATRTFRAVEGQFDTARFFAAATLLKDGRVLITGGYNGHGKASEKVWAYQANT